MVTCAYTDAATKTTASKIRIHLPTFDWCSTGIPSPSSDIGFSYDSLNVIESCTLLFARKASSAIGSLGRTTATGISASCDYKRSQTFGPHKQRHPRQITSHAGIRGDRLSTGA